MATVSDHKAKYILFFTLGNSLKLLLLQMFGFLKPGSLLSEKTKMDVIY